MSKRVSYDDINRVKAKREEGGAGERGMVLLKTKRKLGRAAWSFQGIEPVVALPCGATILAYFQLQISYAVDRGYGGR